MSYILDALRKSEQERQVAAGQTASALYPVMAESSRPRISLGLGFLAAGMALGIAGLAYWFLRSSPPTPVEPVAAPSAPVASSQSPLALPVSPPSVALAPAEPPVQEVVPPAPVAPVILDQRRPPAVVAAKPSPAAPPKPAAVAGQAGAAPELSEDMQKELPPIRIAGYVRDDVGGGMAMINDKLIREGEEVSPGLRLEKILPDGAVFSYKGRRFTR